MDLKAKYRLTGVLIVLSIGLKLPLLSAEDTVQTIKIGISAPLSGDTSSFGTEALQTLQFANDAIAGGKYEFIVEDDRCDGQKAVSIAHSFVQRGVRYVLGIVCSNSLSAAAPIYDKAGIIVVSPSANLEGIASAGKTAFTTMPADQAAMIPLSEYISRKHQAIGILSEQSEMAQQISAAFISSCRSQSREVISEDFAPSSRDFRAQLLKLRSRKIDALFINSQSEATFSAALKQLKELKLHFTLYGAFFPGTEEFIRQAGPLAEGIIFVDLPDLSTSLNLDGAALYEQYKERFGPMKSLQFMFATTLESLRALHLALEHGGDPAGFLVENEYQGIFGPYSFGKDGELQGVRHVMRQIRGGKAAMAEALP